MKALTLAALSVGTLVGTAAAQQTFSHRAPSVPATKNSTAVTKPSAEKRTTPTNHSLLAPPNDLCGSPTSLVGAGPFPFDNTGGTTGAEGQTEATCLFFGFTAIASDVWYTWNATVNGSVTIDLCAAGGTAVDTKLAVYDGNTCPGAAALACNDDSGCGPFGETSTVTLTVVMGQDYTFQIGNYPGGGATAGTGTITITPAAGPPANDACATPTTLIGPGPFPFTNAGGTTGAEGQAEAICLFFGSTNIANDVWYTWNATVTGPVSVDLCAAGGTAVDTKMAAYAGAGCPSGAALACNDDAGCGAFGLSSKVNLSVTMGTDYTFQIGNYPGGGTTAGTGTITITPVVVYPGCQLDDGTTEDAIGGLATGSGILWMNQFGSAGESNVITKISVAYGYPPAPGSSPANGTPVIAGIWNDPDGGDPSNAVLLATAAGAVANTDTNTMNDIIFSPPVVTSGIYLIGVGLVLPGSPQYPASDDTATPSAGRSWIVGNTAAPVNYSSLGTNSIPPLDLDNIELAVFRVRADCTPKGTIDTFCFGDGTGTACPCGNSGGPGRGCANSVNALGALLTGSGTASLTADTLVLDCTGHKPSTAALLFQGTPTTAVLYGDGLRCINGSMKRLFTFLGPNAGTDPIDAPSASSIPPTPATVSGQSATKGDILTAGSVRGYMLVYRDSNRTFCPLPTGGKFNVSNAVKVFWAP